MAGVSILAMLVQTILPMNVPAAFAAPVINEVMGNPIAISDADGEWIEIHNRGTEQTDVSNWTVRIDTTDVYTFAAGKIMAPDEYFVICNNTATAEVACDAEWAAGKNIVNSGGTITISDATSSEIDELVYTGSDASSGQSAEVVREDNNKTIVKNGSDVYNTDPATSQSDHGTPGAANRAMSSAPVQNVTTGEYFTTIQGAIDDTDTVDGNTIFIKNGTYDENPNVSKSLTLAGESEAGVTITADNGGYGLENTVDGLNMTFENFTLANSQHYGFKLTGSDATLKNVTVKNSARSEIDFNGMSSVTLRNVTVDGQVTSGNGVSFTNSNNIDIDGLTTTGNEWGGVALYPYGADYPVGINSVSILNLNASEPNELYVQQGVGGTPVGSINAPQYGFTVTNDEFRANGDQFTFFQRNLANATSFARSLQEAPNTVNNDSAITRISSEVRIVPADDVFTIKAAIEDAPDGGVVRLLAGVYDDDNEQIVVDKEVRLVGSGSDATDVLAQFNTGSSSSGDVRGWFVVEPGGSFDIRNLSLDGNNQNIWQGIRSRGTLSVNQVTFKDIDFNSSYAGTAVVGFGAGEMNVRNSTFENIGRIGAQYFGGGVSGSVFTGNTYTGKGMGDWLDYAVEVGAGAQVRIINNLITDNKGVASTDGSGSAGVLVTTFFGPGSQARINNNTITNNSLGVAVGFDGSDASSVTGRGNAFTGNDTAVNSTVELVDFRQNYWGSNSGPADANATDGSIPATNPGGTGDTAGQNVWYANWTTIDEEKPSLSIDTPGENTSVAGTIAVAGAATDNESVTALELRVFDESCSGSAVVGPIDIFSSYDGTESYSYDLDTSLFADGSYCIKVTATDGSGNKRFKERNVSFDNTAPELTDFNVVANSDGTYDVSVDVDDVDAEVILSVTDGSTTTTLVGTKTNNGNGTATWTATTGALSPSTTYTFTVTATDDSENTSTASSTVTTPAAANGGTSGSTGSAPVVATATSGGNGAGTAGNTGDGFSFGDGAAVLGANDDASTENTGNAEVLGSATNTSDSAAQSDDAEDERGGMAWYWWLLLALLAALVGWYLFAAYKRRQQDNEASL